MNTTSPVGLLIGSHVPPVEIGPLAELAENAGFGELWLAEDLWFTSGVVGAALALAATSTIAVGVGIQSAVTRHTSIQALDFATLSQAHPGRFLPGVGLGLPAWLDQMGLRPPAPLRAVRETVQNVRRLLAGESVTIEGTQRLDGIKLAHPPDVVPPIYIGAVGPKSIRQTGRIADGLVASVLSGTSYVQWARMLLDEEAAASGRPRPRMATFALFSVDDDPAVARAALRPTAGFYLSAMQDTEVVKAHGIGTEVASMAEQGIDRLSEQLPDHWLDELTVCGTPRRCAERIDELLAAGSDSVILLPAPVERSAALAERAGREVLPRIRAGAFT